MHNLFFPCQIVAVIHQQVSPRGDFLGVTINPIIVANNYFTASAGPDGSLFGGRELV